MFLTTFSKQMKIAEKGLDVIQQKISMDGVNEELFCQEIKAGKVLTNKLHNQKFFCVMG